MVSLLFPIEGERLITELNVTNLQERNSACALKLAQAGDGVTTGWLFTIRACVNVANVPSDGVMICRRYYRAGLCCISGRQRAH